ncbi:MAG: TonB C-terminal domain-containing protein [Myxococcales bacterium]
MARMLWRNPEPGEPGGRRLLLAAAVAVAFHLLLALALGLLRPPGSPAPARHPPSIAVVLQGGARSRPADSVTSAPPGASGSDSTQTPRRPRRRGGPAATVAKGEGDRPAGEGFARAPERGPLTKEEVAGEGLLREPGSAGVTTTLRDPIATLNPLGGARGEPRQGPVHVPSREEQLVEEKTRVEGILGGWTEEFQAKERARDPQDVYWRDMQEALSRSFRVDFEPTKSKPERPVSPIGQAFAAYQRAAESYAKTGSAYADASRSVSTLPAAERGLSGTSLEGAKAATDLQQLAQAQFGNGGWNKKLVVLIQIVQAPDGTIDAAQVTTTSGNEAYDGTALTQVRKLLGKGVLGAPPSGRRRTVWAFETDFSTMPPLPVAGCTLGATFVPGECYYPFKRTVRSRIYLEAIY